MYLDDVLAAQKRGESRGIASICSAHPAVLKETLKLFERPLIEATCNQVNQYGGYTGMTPEEFVAYIRRIADENHFPFERIILGGDHLGPSVWQNESAQIAMQKAALMVAAYVRAGFTKIHLDCSMKLADDPPGALDVEVSAGRAARLAEIAESSLPEKRGRDDEPPRYVIGTEVPIPGGATFHEEGVHVTKVEDVRQTIEVTREAFARAGLRSAWERVVAVVVQPGVEFGDDFVLPYQSAAAHQLSGFIEGQSLMYEAHSTDYQTRAALKELVRDHFGILKVGPALTFAFRAAIFSLALIEAELMPADERSNILRVIDEVMMKHSEYWKKYYQGDTAQQAFKRKFSLSDRIRYYWVQPEVQQALLKLKRNLEAKPVPYALLNQYAPFAVEAASVIDGVISARVSKVLADYAFACGG